MTADNDNDQTLQNDENNNEVHNRQGFNHQVT